jgi:hypothetical protein
MYFELRTIALEEMGYKIFSQKWQFLPTLAPL